jgi:hypothetical protein
MVTTTTTEQTPTVYFLTQTGLDALTAKVDQLNRRAKRLDVPAITIEATPATRERDGWAKDSDGMPILEYHPETGRHQRKQVKVVLEGFEVRLGGESPKLNGWQFVATLQHEGAGNIVRNISGLDLPEQYRTSASGCDHCGTYRRRRDTYVVRHDDGRYMQVGKQCLRDFTGHSSPDALASWLEVLAELGRTAEEAEDSDKCGGGRGYRMLGVAELLQFAVMFVRLNGYVSKKQAEAELKVGTGQLVVLLLTDRDQYDKAKERGAVGQIEQADIDRAAAILEWVRGDFGGKGQLSEYEHNLQVSLSTEYVNLRMASFAVSAVVAHQRAMGELESKKRAKAELPAEPYLGKVGDRLRNIKATVTFVHSVDGMYGVTTFCRFTTETGHLLQWKASGAVGLQIGPNWHGIEAGQEVLLTGTVDSHGPDKYNGELPTNFLKRCKLTPTQEPEAPRGQF